jgi:hypothetical protein
MMIVVAALAAASLAGRNYGGRRQRAYHPSFGSNLNVTANVVPKYEPGRTENNFALK